MHCFSASRVITAITITVITVFTEGVSEGKAYHTLFFIYSLLRLAKFNILLLPSRFLIRHIHSYQDAGGTRQKIGGNLLAKHP